MDDRLKSDEQRIASQSAEVEAAARALAAATESVATVDARIEAVNQVLHRSPHTHCARCVWGFTCLSLLVISLRRAGIG